MNAAAMAERRALQTAIAAGGYHIAARPQIDPVPHYGDRTGVCMTNECLFVKNWDDTRYYLVFDLCMLPGVMGWQRAVVDDYGTLVIVGLHLPDPTYEAAVDVDEFGRLVIVGAKR